MQDTNAPNKVYQLSCNIATYSVISCSFYHSYVDGICVIDHFFTC